MKMKLLLFAFVVFALTTFTAIAQDAKVLSPAAKETIQVKKNNFSRYYDHNSSALLHDSAKTAFPLLGHPSNLEEFKKYPSLYKQIITDKRYGPLLPIRRKNDVAFETIASEKNSSSDFHLTKDINSLSGSFPVISSKPILNGVMYFQADDGIHGNELWRSDGTKEGTYMAVDVNPGSESSTLYSITAVNGKLYFTSYTSSNVPVIWVSDGTKSGTQLLKKNLDVDEQFVGLGNAVYFTVYDNLSSHYVLWKTDGTTAGTVPVKDIKDDGFDRSSISQLTAANNLLFFTTYNYSTAEWELWRSNGTSKGTYLVGSGPSLIFGDEPIQLTSYNNQLYFSADDGTGAHKLWVSDGTVAGTKPAPGNHNVQIEQDAYRTPFPILNNMLYVTGKFKGAKIDALFKYDATSNKGLLKVKDVATGNKPASIDPKEMAVVNNILYFKVTNYNGGLHEELWSSKGNANTTVAEQKFRSGETISSLYNESGKLYFVRDSKLFGAELWSAYTNSHTTVLYIVDDIFKGRIGSNPNSLTGFKGKLFFVATDDKKGTELFMTNGTPMSTAVVKDINTAATENSYAGYFGMAPLGNTVVFSAYDEAHGFELYRSDGTDSGTVLLNDIIPGSSSGVPGYINEFEQTFINKNNSIYFIAFNTNSTVAIYKTDGTPAGLQKMTPDFSDEKYDYADYPISYNVANNGLLYYGIDNLNTGAYELWRSDGTAAGTILLSSALYHGGPLVVKGNTVFFIAKDATHGYELWKSDGTVAGTGLIKDINPGNRDAKIWNLFIYNNEVYFGAYDGVHYSLWKSDGSKKGTVKLKDIRLRSEFCICDNILYFGAEDYIQQKGTELWKTDGTVAGTKLIKDINPKSSYAAYYDYLIDVNGTLFFATDDGVHGEELWKSDGTTKGTQLVKDITPGAEGTYLSNFVSYKGKLYFINDGVLWTSDGTNNGTVQVNDAVIKNVEAYNLATTPEMLYVAGYTHRYGYELYAGQPSSNTSTITMAKLANQPVAKTIATFYVTLSPNPAVADALMQITGDIQKVFVTIRDENGKQLWQSSNHNENVIHLPTAKLAAGMYFITVTNGKEGKTLKLMKQ